MADIGTTRREFLSRIELALAGSAALGLSASVRGAQTPAQASATASSLPQIQLGPHRLSRLILGGNPVYGYSHFNQLYDRHLRDYHTPERVLELLRACEAAGINTWQNSWAPRTVDDVERCRTAGVKFHWLLLGKPDWEKQPEVIAEAARHKPIGIAPHGSLAERLHRAGKVADLKDLLKRIRDTGVLVGLSSHNPALVELAEGEGWDVDYYMCCLYYLTRPRDELAKLIGETPIGEVYLPSDRPKMLSAVRAARKPCLIYKVFAAGRLELSAEAVRATLETTLAAIKPSDGMIVGMFQEFGDQVGMNARAVREARKA
ncbi:MAG TPA: hypothetical protein VFD71_16110 [Planctomycetota bacterium]|jgi:hypothetical protein|nr:hypothetical protein [Planctomycetota bacterium]